MKQSGKIFFDDALHINRSLHTTEDQNEIYIGNIYYIWAEINRMIRFYIVGDIYSAKGEYQCRVRNHQQST